MARKARLLREARGACQEALAPRSRVSNDERPRRGAGPFWGVPQSITVKPLARVSRQPTVIVTRVSSACYGSIIPMGDKAAIAGRCGTMVARAFSTARACDGRTGPFTFRSARGAIFWRGSVWRLSEHFNCSRVRIQRWERSQLNPVCLRLNGGGKAGPLPWTGARRPHRGEKLTARELCAAGPYILRVHLVQIAVVNPVPYFSPVTWGICRCEVLGGRT